MLKLSFLNLFRRKSRTALAFIGIIIGITAIIAMVGTVDGMLGEMTDIIANMQAVMVYEKGAIDQTLSQLPLSYGKKLETINGVRMVMPELWVLPTSIEGKGVRAVMSTFVYGVDLQKYNSLRNPAYGMGEIEKGSTLLPGDRKSVVIGKQLAENYHKFIGSKIEINDVSFRVKGIYEAESELFGGMILMNIDDARNLSTLASDKVHSFYVELIDPARDREIVQLIKFKFDDVEAMSGGTFSEQYGGILENFRLAVFAVAAISALVAGVGIANTILMSVMERKKEIGTLKAVGWTNWNVMKMILYESAFVGIVGGILGLISGYAAAWAIENYLGLTTLVMPMLAAEAFLFAVSLGIIAGIYPAYRASKLDPIEALGG